MRNTLRRKILVALSRVQDGKPIFLLKHVSLTVVHREISHL